MLFTLYVPSEFNVIEAGAIVIVVVPSDIFIELIVEPASTVPEISVLVNSEEETILSFVSSLISILLLVLESITSVLFVLKVKGDIELSSEEPSSLRVLEFEEASSSSSFTLLLVLLSSSSTKRFSSAKRLRDWIVATFSPAAEASKAENSEPKPSITTP